MIDIFTDWSVSGYNRNFYYDTFNECFGILNRSQLKAIIDELYKGVSRNRIYKLDYIAMKGYNGINYLYKGDKNTEWSMQRYVYSLELCCPYGCAMQLLDRNLYYIDDVDRGHIPELTFFNDTFYFNDRDNTEMYYYTDDKLVINPKLKKVSKAFAMLKA